MPDQLHLTPRRSIAASLLHRERAGAGFSRPLLCRIHWPGSQLGNLGKREQSNEVLMLGFTYTQIPSPA